MKKRSAAAGKDGRKGAAVVTLTPRSFPKDGNSFYVMFSTIMYDTHDNHAEVRRKVWNLFSEKATGLSVEQLLSLSAAAVAQGEGPASVFAFTEECRSEEWFYTWVATFDPRARGGGRVDLSHPRYADALVTMLQTHMMNRVEAPAMEIVAPLVSELFGIVIVLYVGDKEKYAKQEPSRIWYPPGYTNTVRHTHATMIKHVHLLQADPSVSDFQLLVRPNPLARPIPTRVMGPLTLQEVDGKSLQQKEEKPWESELIKQYAVYTLGVYDSVRCKHYIIGRFIAPETGRNPEAKLSHYINLDARFALSDKLIFVIKGCQATQKPIYIFATKTVNGQRMAVLIGYWPVDYTDPRIGLEKTDDGVVIVPVNDRAMAIQTLVTECKCQVLEHR